MRPPWNFLGEKNILTAFGVDRMWKIHAAATDAVQLNIQLNVQFVFELDCCTCAKFAHWNKFLPLQNVTYEKSKKHAPKQPVLNPKTKTVNISLTIFIQKTKIN